MYKNKSGAVLRRRNKGAKLSFVPLAFVFALSLSPVANAQLTEQQLSTILTVVNSFLLGDSGCEDSDKDTLCDVDEIAYFGEFEDSIEQISLNVEDHSEFIWFDGVDYEPLYDGRIDKNDPEIISIKKGFSILQGESLVT